MEGRSFAKDHLRGSWIAVPWNTNLYEDSDDNTQTGENKTEPEAEARLCGRCRNIFLRGFEWGKTEKQTIVLNAIDALSQCKLCGLLLDRLFNSIDHEYVGEQNFESSLRVWYWLDVRDGHFHAAYNICFQASALPSEAAPILRLAVQHRDPIGYYDMPWYQRQLPEATSSPQATQQATGWLEKCIQNHDICRAITLTAPTLPKRLIHIGQSASSEEPLHLRLIDSKTIRPETRYVTLSHCWGSSMTKKLLLENLDDYLIHIPLAGLPRVFQDAAHVAKQLDLVYIWIDSLCIIQNSARDWAAESARMGLIYKNSHLNIAATGFADGTRGLFTSRDSSLLLPIPIRLERDIMHIYEREDGEIHRQKRLENGNYLLYDVDVFRNGVETAPLNERGWVVQERSLSPRTLHFGVNQLYWECAQQVACEVFPKGLSRCMPRVNAKRLESPTQIAKGEEVMTPEMYQADLEYLNSLVSLPKETLRRMPRAMQRSHRTSIRKVEESIAIYEGTHKKAPEERLMRKTNKGMTEVQHRWRDVVQNFSGCALTYSSDKLIAISGLAREAVSTMRCDYLAGLWRDDLEHQLLWRVTKPRPSPRATGKRGPTWSWAAVDGPVTMSDWSGRHHTIKEGEIKWYAHVVEASTRPAAGDVYGHIGSGRLVMSGLLGVLRIKKRDTPVPDATDENIIHIERQARIHWDNQDLQTQFGPSGDSIVFRHAAYTSPASKTRCVSQMLDVFVMPVRVMEEDPDGRDWEAPLLAGLLLLPTRKRRGQYHRVGLIEATQHWYGDGAIRPFTNKTTILESTFFTSVDADGQYTIEIV